MPLYRSPALVLKCSPWLEADKLVFLFTRNFGKVKGIASGACRTKSKFGGSLEALTLVHVIYFLKEGRELAKIDSCDVICPFLGLKEDFERLKRALYVLELGDVVLPLGEPNVRLFGVISRVLHLLEKVDDLDGTLRGFELQVLTMIGLAPQVDCCVECGGPVGEGGFHFSPRLGGLVCTRCSFQAREEAFRVSSKAVSFMRRGLADRLTLSKKGEPSGYPLGEIQQILQRHIQTHLGRELRSARMINL